MPDLTMKYSQADPFLGENVSSHIRPWNCNTLDSGFLEYTQTQFSPCEWSSIETFSRPADATMSTPFRYSPFHLGNDGVMEEASPNGSIMLSHGAPQSFGDDLLSPVSSLSAMTPLTMPLQDVHKQWGSDVFKAVKEEAYEEPDLSSLYGDDDCMSPGETPVRLLTRSSTRDASPNYYLHSNHAEYSDPQADENSSDGDWKHMSYAKLIYYCLIDAPDHALPLKDIYSWIAERAGKGEEEHTGWQNSIRHNLSMNAAFEKVANQKGNGKKKGRAWRLTDQAQKEGVHSTTRYRKKKVSKGASSTSRASSRRACSGSKGGVATRNSYLRRMQSVRLESPLTAAEEDASYQDILDDSFHPGLYQDEEEINQPRNYRSPPPQQYRFEMEHREQPRGDQAMPDFVDCPHAQRGSAAEAGFVGANGPLTPPAAPCRGTFFR